jgi:hypothetical protein
MPLEKCVGKRERGVIFLLFPFLEVSNGNSSKKINKD